MRARGWILIILGCLLLCSTLSATVAVIALLIALLILWFVQMGRINFLLAKIQKNIRKLQEILQKMLPKN